MEEGAGIYRQQPKRHCRRTSGRLMRSIIVTLTAGAAAVALGASAAAASADLELGSPKSAALLDGAVVSFAAAVAGLLHDAPHGPRRGREAGDDAGCLGTSAAAVNMASSSRSALSTGDVAW
jgi:hypothetical protein